MGPLPSGFAKKTLEEPFWTKDSGPSKMNSQKTCLREQHTMNINTYKHQKWAKKTCYLEKWGPGAVACALSGEKSRWSWAISLVPTFGKTTRKTLSWLSSVLQWSVAFQLPSGYDTHSHGKSLINGCFNGKIIYFHVPFSMAMLNNQRVQVKPIGFCDLVVLTTSVLHHHLSHLGFCENSNSS